MVDYQLVAAASLLISAVPCIIAFFAVLSARKWRRAFRDELDARMTTEVELIGTTEKLTTLHESVGFIREQNRQLRAENRFLGSCVDFTRHINPMDVMRHTSINVVKPGDALPSLPDRRITRVSLKPLDIAHTYELDDRVQHAVPAIAKEMARAYLHKIEEQLTLEICRAWDKAGVN